MTWSKSILVLARVLTALRRSAGMCILCVRAEPEIQPVGSCPIETEYIESFEECADAVAALNLTGAPLEEFTSASNPHGCYFKVPTSEFWFNTAGDKSDADTERQSICCMYPSDPAACLVLAFWQYEASVLLPLFGFCWSSYLHLTLPYSCLLFQGGATAPYATLHH